MQRFHLDGIYVYNVLAAMESRLHLHARRERFQAVLYFEQDDHATVSHEAHTVSSMSPFSGTGQPAGNTIVRCGQWVQRLRKQFKRRASASWQNVPVHDNQLEMRISVDRALFDAQLSDRVQQRRAPAGTFKLWLLPRYFEILYFSICWRSTSVNVACQLHQTIEQLYKCLQQRCRDAAASHGTAMAHLLTSQHQIP
jgi:hypothetical protein